MIFVDCCCNWHVDTEFLGDSEGNLFVVEIPFDNHSHVVQRLWRFSPRPSGAILGTPVT